MRASNDVTGSGGGQRLPGVSAPRIVVFVEDGGGDWHARQLKDAMERAGAEVHVTSLKCCAFDTRHPFGIDIPGFPATLPDGAFVRSISTGSLEQITLRLGILHALRESGVRVWNDARAIERCVDKSTATFLFQKAGLPVPRTRAAEGIAAARAFLANEAAPIVVKPLFGSQGNGIRRVMAEAELPTSDEVGDVYYTQRYLRRPEDTEFQDWRVFVSRGRTLAAMMRVGETWITNIHQGARAVGLAEASAGHDGCELDRLAHAATAAIGADYAGVDLIRDHDGQLMVLEINSNPAWKGLQGVTDVDIAARLAEDFLDCLTVVQAARAP
ncbi:MAG: RimK family alpha-L-glutamate ligase [Hyphomicrobiaceae bacterium]|nr:RimK family alpha-L-glutamate ligase [Hyphomicrobiaceae bacterium]